ncbi:uncharacterized protein [Temnothorax nylanderi]|uniref:uncharacterized protein n=1 Tax=Temnothorax nylanderi TaxID=102681 RepID=UPI003A86EDC1
MNVFDRMELIGKLGSDGSSGYGSHMHIPKRPSTSSSSDDSAFIEEEEIIPDSGSTPIKYDDDKLFLISYVPLRLLVTTIENKEHKLWVNPRPSSPRYCRPVRFVYAKEDKQLVKKEISEMNQEMDNLKPTVLEAFLNIEVHHQLHFTMVDGKTINILTDTANSRCYICNAGPKQMADLSTIKNRKITEGYLKYGLSTLHGWIKCLDCILHISYKLELKTATVRGADVEQRAIIQHRKKEIPAKLKDALGISVDQVCCGSGTSNTGNVARKFFSNWSIVSDITGVDGELIRRLGIIMIALSSAHAINVTKFDEYCWDTVVRMMDLYPWFQMFPSVHKLLVHEEHTWRTSNPGDTGSYWNTQ